MNIYVMDPSFEVIGVIDDYTSVIWTTRYTTPGDFELYLAADSKNIGLLAVNNYLVREQDFSNGQAANVMIIRNLQLTTDAENGDNLIATGPDLKGILARRVINGQTLFSGKATACLRQLISDHLVSPTDTNRAVLSFSIGADAIQTEHSMQVQITGTNLAEAVAEICERFGYGYRVSINGGFVFQIYEGVDRSLDQSANPHVIFSSEFDNLISSTYGVDSTDYATTAYVAGEGEGVDRKIVETGAASGLNRYEVWVDARNASSNDGEITDADYLAMLEQQGAEEIAARAVTTSFEGEVDDTVNYTANVDYFLGDKVQIANDYGITAAARIVELIEAEDETGVSIIPTFAELEV